MEAKNNVNFDPIMQKIEDIRHSYTAPLAAEQEKEYSKRFPVLEEVYMWHVKSLLYQLRGKWIEAYGCNQHAMHLCKVTSNCHFREIVAGIPLYEAEEHDNDVELPYKDVYDLVIQAMEGIMELVDPSEFNANTPSDDFLLPYQWSFDPYEDAKLIVAHWQDMISRRDFHIFSEQQCYLILLEFYFFYWFQLDTTDKECLLDVIRGCIDKAICASPINTEANENTLLDPWVIHTEDGCTINAYKRPNSIEYMEVLFWSWKSDLYHESCYSNKESESILARKHAEFLDRIYFFDTKEYALSCEYFTPEYLAWVYRNNIDKDTKVDLEKYAAELLEINPAAKLPEFTEYIKGKEEKSIEV